ncbi:ribosome biogenesis protein kri1 [Grosmannia clavigera kw1407]|uniref:Ribosome biogenesis protein kri1 n=1 Tax=Grosmannia clavigera (strain kw1407 / UAMH 11150) TaxID=655863 RepID=F0XAE1_GROCL|nr:ribosome biogenesis protein kri1 [Grosmannia clavigera kw1407]EFX05425.1 ribosome biogenesis protein kri1 [Grosmannia clavigera kw1407]
MSSILSRVFGAVSTFTGKNKASDSESQEKAGQPEAMAGAKDSGLATTPGKNPRKRLFDDEGDEEEAEDVGTSKSLGKTSSFTINEEYARRFEHNKKREEMHKLEEKYGKGAAKFGADDEEDDSSTDESEDEDGYLLTEDLDARMTEALQAIKNKDPRIYNAETKFFDPSEIDQMAADAAKAGPSESKQKPMFLRDYHRERYLRGDIGAEDRDEDEDVAVVKAVPKTYQQEQDEVKQALIHEMNAAGEDSDSNGDKAAGAGSDDDVDTFIKPKASSKAAKAASQASEKIHPSRAGRVAKISGEEIANASKNPELFLSNFMASRAWVPEDKSEGPGWRAFESDDDESENDRAEEFEAAYNMRFEDPAKSNEVLKSYSRSVVAQRSVRRDEKTSRQRQREQEKEQEAAEKRERKEERTRLRKLRLEEAQEKLAKIKQAAGLRGKEMNDDEWAELLDDAWDTDRWEAKMRSYFGDTYYSQPDAGLESDDDDDDQGSDSEKKAKKAKKSKSKVKKPQWDDDIDINDIIPDFEATEPQITLSDEEGEGPDEAADNDDDNDDDDDDDGEQPSKRRKTTKDRKQERVEAKRQARRERARLEAIVDRQMELDAPTALAGSRGRSGFRYRETSPQSFGLTPRDILLAPSDAALNDFAGLKKLATFRDEERKRKDRKTLGKKARLRQWRRETFGHDFELTGPTYGFERLLGDKDASASDHHRRKSKSEKTEKTEKTGKTGKTGNPESDKPAKKRKRSGRKGKGTEAESESAKTAGQEA